MNKITHEVWIDAPRQKVWDVLADFGNVYLTNPYITKSYLTSDQKTGVGTTRHCDLTLFGATVEERIIGWDEGRSIEIDIYDRKNLPVIKTQGAAFTLQDENGGTRLRGAIHYTLKYGPIGALMNTFMLKPQNTKAWTTFLAGIKHYAETGEAIDSNVYLNLEPVTAVA